MARRRTPTDEVMTEVFSEAGDFPQRTSEAATKVSRRPVAPPAVIEDPTDVDQLQPIRVISMKAPGDTAGLDGDKHAKVLPRPQIRSISEVHRVPATDLGNLARPVIDGRGTAVVRAAEAGRGSLAEGRRRRLLTNIGWGIAVIAIALVVAIALWFIMQRR